MKNKGFSLVELLIAISISAIVAGSVGYLLSTSLSMFGNETANIAEQQELQTSLNMIMDYAMESQTVVVNNSATKTEYLALGSIDSTNSADLNAVVFFTDDNNKLYMCKKSIANYKATSPKNLDERVEEIKTNALNDAATLPQYLLAENVTLFLTELNGTKVEGSDRLYNNPLSLDITLEFFKEGSTKNIQKRVSDKAVFRNNLDKETNIYKNHLDYKQKVDSLVIETETVKLAKNTAEIKIPGTKVVPKPNLSILEIVPDYSYDYAQYIIGGYKGDINNAVNVTYGASAGYEPITSGELEGYILQTCGATDQQKGYTNANNISLISGFYPNIGVDLNAIVQTPQTNRNGYYEYVGQSNGGVYAIDSYTENGGISLELGFGDSKPIVLGFTKNYSPYNDGDKKNWTERVFNPVFEYCSYEDTNKDYYKAVIDPSGVMNDYIVETAEKDGTTYEYYKYVGYKKGDVSLNFIKDYYRNKQSYNKYNGYCYAVSESYDAIDEEHGQYYACISGWETRSNTSSYAWGYDFVKTIGSAVMYSKYFNHPQKSSVVSGDFGWVWHEAEPGTSMYDDINNGVYYTSVGALNEGTKEAGEQYSRGTRLYLKNHYRYGLVNNELFKLYVMQDTLEQYVDGPKKMIDILNGRYDVKNNRYSEVNDNAVKKWENAGNYVKLNVRIPADLTDDDIKNCDMIVVGTADDGGFKFANQWFNNIRNANATRNFSSTNDITFKQATEIYKRVCADQISIACPYNLKSVGGTSGALNISKMYYMTYCITNWDLVSTSAGQWYPDEVKKETVKNHIEKKKEEQGEVNYWTINPDYMKDIEGNVMAKGCGRDFFKDFLQSMSGEELSKPLYDNGTLDKTTKYVSVDANGNIIVPGTSPISVWGAGGGSGLSDFEKNFLRCNTNNYLMDRYRAAIGGNVYPKTKFVLNPEYGHHYKFYYDDASEGINKNMLLYNQKSDLFSFKTSGAFGLMQLKTINQNATPYVQVDEDQPVGTIRLVGYGVGSNIESEGDDRGRYNLPENHESLTYEKCIESGMFYQHEFTELGKVSGDTSDEITKVLYLTDEELEQAKKVNNGVFVYMIVESDMDLYPHLSSDADKENPYLPYLNYSRHPNVSEIFPDTPGEAVKYAKNDEGKFVTEFRAQIPCFYFNKLVASTEFEAPTNGGDNFAVARVGEESGVWTQFPKTDEMFGHENFYICVRDTLDLD